jgi:hypothetical protein
MTVKSLNVFRGADSKVGGAYEDCHVLRKKRGWGFAGYLRSGLTF